MPPAFQLDVIDPASDAAEDVGLARQVMAADLVTRGDGPERGVRSVLLQSDLLSLEVVVDRGMDIAGARVRQMPVAWQSPTGIVAPWLIEQRDAQFLRGFYGGLLTTCGLDHVGHPTDRSAERFAYPHRALEHLPMHGRISGTPARLAGYGVERTASGLTAFVAGTVAQVAVFGEHLVLSRRISITYGSCRISVADTVTNNGYAASPLAMMYHVNLGWPVLAPGAVVSVDGEHAAGDVIPAEITAPVRGSAQHVSAYSMRPDDAGRANASIVNPRVDEGYSGGVHLSWNASALPSMVRWQVANTAGHYVLGLEPSTARMNNGTGGEVFPILEPGQSRDLGVTIDLERRPIGATPIH